MSLPEKGRAMYDIYHHVDRKEFQLTVLRGSDLPKKAPAAKWRLFANRKLVPKIVSDEITRSGYCVTKPKKNRV
jgi:hypothetical protein